MGRVFWAPNRIVSQDPGGLQDNLQNVNMMQSEYLSLLWQGQGTIRTDGGVKYLEMASLAGTLALLVVHRDDAGLAGAQLPEVLRTPADKACGA